MDSNDSQKPHHSATLKPSRHLRLGIFLLIVVIAVLFLRYSYFIFVQDLSTLKEVPTRDLTALLKAKLAIPVAIKVASHKSPGDSIIIDEKWDTVLSDIKVDTNGRGPIYVEAKFTISSKTNEWNVILDEYYYDCTLAAADKDRLLVFCGRAGTWHPNKRCYGSPIGCGGPSPLTNILVNTARNGWYDYYLINRKTGSIIKRFRYSDILARGVFDSNSLYFHLAKDKYVKFNIDR